LRKGSQTSTSDVGPSPEMAVPFERDIGNYLEVGSVNGWMEKNRKNGGDWFLP